MHAPSARLLRTLKSSLASAHPTTPFRHIDLLRIRSVSAVQTKLQPLVFPRSYAASSRADTTGDSGFTGNNGKKQNQNRSQPQSPQQDSHHHPRPRRHFDRSTADLKADLQARRLESASSHEPGQRNTTRGRGRDNEIIEEEESRRSERTDLGALDVFADVAAPSTAIDACLDDGFHLNNGMKIAGGDGCLLVDGEAFTWRPWEAGSSGALVNEKGQWEIAEEAWGVLRLVWPKPDLLILGLGRTVRPISPATRRCINELGIRIEVQDTRNAAAQFNLLATERGVREVAAALIPLGFRV